jgi:hypothetical protein
VQELLCFALLEDARVLYAVVPTEAVVCARFPSRGSVFATTSCGARRPVSLVHGCLRCMSAPVGAVSRDRLGLPPLSSGVVPTVSVRRIGLGFWQKCEAVIHPS